MLAEVCQALSNFGRNRAESQMMPNSGQIRSTHSQLWATIAEFWPTLADIGLILVESRSISAESRAMLPDCGRMSPKYGRVLSKSGRLRAKSDRSNSKVGAPEVVSNFRPHSAPLRPKSARTGLNLSDFDPSCPDLGNHCVLSENLFGPRHGMLIKRQCRDSSMAPRETQEPKTPATSSERNQRGTFPCGRRCRGKQAPPQ